MVLGLIDVFLLGIPKKSKDISFIILINKRCSSALGPPFGNEFLGEGTTATKVELNEVQEVKKPSHSKDTIESNLIRSNPDHIEVPLRRSSRVPHQPNDTTISWSGMVIPLSSMRTMRIQSPT